MLTDVALRPLSYVLHLRFIVCSCACECVWWFVSIYQLNDSPVLYVPFPRLTLEEIQPRMTPCRIYYGWMEPWSQNLCGQAPVSNSSSYTLAEH